MTPDEEKARASRRPDGLVFWTGFPFLVLGSFAPNVVLAPVLVALAVRKAVRR